MGSFTFFDYLFNVCRSLSDVLHICSYLLLVVIALIVALYKYDAELYSKYIYIPLVKFLWRNGLLTTNNFNLKFVFFKNFFYPSRWTSSSNRLPYFIKFIKNFFKKF